MGQRPVVAAHLHRALLGLHEDEHGWRKALLDDASQREQLTLLVRVSGQGKGQGQG